MKDSLNAVEKTQKSIELELSTDIDIATNGTKKESEVEYVKQLIDMQMQIINIQKTIIKANYHHI